MSLDYLDCLIYSDTKGSSEAEYVICDRIKIFVSVYTLQSKSPVPIRLNMVLSLSIHVCDI